MGLTLVLTTNGTPIQARFLAGALASQAPMQGRAAMRRISNALAFGTDTSWPQGFQSVLRALVPPLAESGQIAVQMGLPLDLTAALVGIGNIAASPAVEFSATVAANVLSNLYATFAVEADATAALRAQGGVSAVFDWVSRPSANDIAQEVWNSFQIEAGMGAGDVLRVLLAVAAGKTAITGTGPVVVTFRDQADTMDRVRAEMTGSERDAVTVDGGA